MTIRLVEAEIQRFLASPESEVLCVRGKWGIGKTYSWREFLKRAHSNNKIALDRYAYVSLFGINSIDELKYAIFENTVPKELVAGSANLDSLKSVFESAELLGRKGAWMVRFMPWLQSSFGAVAPALFLTVRKQIICIDDLERKGAKLAVSDVLGLISLLKEQRDCKVVLLLNEEALEGNGKQEFETYLEKVVDVSLKFSPTANDAVRIALVEESESQKLISKNCSILGISNIRVIKKIERLVKNVEPLLSSYDDQVFYQATHTLTLFGWSIFEPTIAPNIEFLKTRRGAVFRAIAPEGQEDMDGAKWNSLLDTYGLSDVDEFDLVLLQGIRDGYFDDVTMKRTAEVLDQRIKASKSDQSFESAWSLYHDSFNDNLDEVVNAIREAFLANARTITPMNLNGTVSLMKDLGKPEYAAEIIAFYVDSRGSEHELFDLENYPFSNSVTDTDVIAAFNAKLASFVDDRDPQTLLLQMAKDSWHTKDLEKLAGVSVDEYYRIFLEGRGRELRKMVDACLQFDRISNPSAPMKEISRRAREALGRLGRESLINARRVSRYGIHIDP